MEQSLRTNWAELLTSVIVLHQWFEEKWPSFWQKQLNFWK